MLEVAHHVVTDEASLVGIDTITVAHLLRGAFCPHLLVYAAELIDFGLAIELGVVPQMPLLHQALPQGQVLRVNSNTVIICLTPRRNIPTER
jgi:hypothetical protein